MGTPITKTYHVELRHRMTGEIRRFIISAESQWDEADPRDKAGAMAFVALEPQQRRTSWLVHAVDIRVTEDPLLDDRGQPLALVGTFDGNAAHAAAQTRRPFGAGIGSNVARFIEHLEIWQGRAQDGTEYREIHMFRGNGVLAVEPIRVTDFNRQEEPA